MKIMDVNLEVYEYTVNETLTTEILPVIVKQHQETWSTHLTQDGQLAVLREEQLSCLASINQTQIPTEGLFCPAVWDGAYCWPYTAAGTTTTTSCPDYIHGFNASNEASKFCTHDGTWWRHPDLNLTWTNYTLCGGIISSEESTDFIVHVPIIKVISQIGYAVSLTLLLVACLLLGSIKRLRCPRNNLHLQLFASFILRASLSIFRGTHKPGIKQTLFCKIIASLWQYSLMANFCWILMEGLYLHNLLFLSIFTDSTGIFRYGVAGWGLPVLFIVPWIALKAVYEDNLCWTVNKNASIFWVIRGPITASIVLNFIIFINITRVLFLKMFSSVQDAYSRRYRYRKWFRSTLVLVPLFGVHYALFLSFSLATGINEKLEVAWLYLDQTFTSFQGSFVAMLYCFLNGEVQSEVRKLYERVKKSEYSNVQNSLLTHSLTYGSKCRASNQSLNIATEDKDKSRNGSVPLQSPPHLNNRKDDAIPRSNEMTSTFSLI